jgi:hypothetical protein
MNEDTKNKFNDFLNDASKKDNNVRENRVQITYKIVEDVYGKNKSNKEKEQLKRWVCRNNKILCDASS